MTHTNVITMNVPITAYVTFIVLSCVVCPSDIEHLEITVLQITTASTNHVILKTAHALRVDVNVDMREYF